MSKCRTCEYALYDGLCLAEGKYTLLDAPACDVYKPRIDVEVSQLKAENAKLRELVLLKSRRNAAISRCFEIACDECPVKELCDKEDELMHELGIGVSK